MSDFIIEILEPAPFLLEVSEPVEQIVDINVGSNELTPTINLEIVNTEKILLSDLPDIEISKILGLLEYVQDVIGLSGVVGGSGVTVSYNDSTGFTTINVNGEFGLTTEQVDDRVSQLLVAGSGIGLSYNDSANTLTISTTGEFGLSAEQVDDRVSQLLVGGTGISLSYNDASNLLSINVSTGIPVTNLVSSGITLGNTTINLGQTSLVLDGLTRISGVSSGNPVYLYNAYIDGGTP